MGNVWRRRAAVAVLAGLAVSGELAIGARAGDPCTDPARSALDPVCLPGGTAGQTLRQACDYQWVPGVCDSTRFADPRYQATDDPSPGQPLALRIGAVHEHSGYSDGDPATIPRDYFRAGRTGHNTADAGGDTGVRLDFMFSSEHSDNGQLPITTNAQCLEPAHLLDCWHGGEIDDYWKWDATLRQAIEETDTGFTAARGFEWTNDYFNHMNVYFSTNFRNVKIDGSYASMDVMWDWLRRPVAEGGGADGLVTFNHPGGNPKLSPFDGDQPHNALLAEVPGGGNWNDVAYVPDVDERVVGMEVNGGDDIEWYVKALTNGWHIGAVAAEDEHQREWSSSADKKTLMLTRGRSPRDYYFALQNHRTIAIHDALVGGGPGDMATFPTIHFYADGSGPGGAGIHDPAATLLGATLPTPGPHVIHFEASGLPAGSEVALVSDTGGGQQQPIALGAADGGGAISASHPVETPASGEDWWFAVVCPPGGDTPCGAGQDAVAITAPIWLEAPAGG